MENRSVGVGITGMSVLVAVVAIAFRSGPTIASNDTPQTTAAVVQKDEARAYAHPDSAVAGYDRGRELLAEYFGNSWETVVARADSAAARDSTRLQKRIPLHVTIAAIPDPYDSYLDWAYDANLEAMRRAFDAAELRSQSFWLPQRTDSLRVIEDGVSTRVPAHDFEPGVMLFRSGSADNPLLHLLYLVPEVPTAGLHPMAFRAALAERKAIMMQGKSIFLVDDRERAQLSILGPNFSGSAISFRAMVDASLVGKGAQAAQAYTPQTARIVTGSATAFANQRTLTDTTRVVLPARDTSPAKQVSRIRFMATVNPDEAMNEVVDQLVKGLKLQPYQVALLTESGTGYGAGRVTTERNGPVQSDTVSYLTVPFPLNIGSLRRAFEQSGASTQQGPSVPGLGEAPRTRLSLDERARGHETPVLISDLSVPALDVVLGSLIHTLNEHDVRLVIIKATDVRDKLMLARELRRGLPDVLLVIYGGHVLLRRAEYADALRGALVVSSYPLALENQFWTTAHRGSGDSSYTHLTDLFAFPTEASIGIYNAMLTLLDQPQDRVEFSLHSGEGEEKELRVPPMWLSVIGRDGFYPLSAQQPDTAWWSYLGVGASDPEIPEKPGGRLHEHTYTHDDVSLSLLIVVPMLLMTALLTTFMVGGDALLAIGLTVPRTLSRPDSARESLFLAIFLLSLVAAYLPFSVAVDARRVVASLDKDTAGASVALWIVMILSAVVFAAGLWLLFNGLVGVLKSHRIDRTGGMASDTSMPRPLRNVSARQRFEDLVTAIRRPSHVTREMEQVTTTETLYEYRRLTTRQEDPFIANGGAVFIAAISLLFLFCSVRFTIHLIMLSHKGGPEATISMYRAMHMASGVSPLVPLVILGLTFAIWSWWQLQQARTFDHHDPFESGVRLLAHDEEAETIWRRLYRSMVEARRGMSWMAPGLGVVAILLAVGATAWFVERRRLGSLEVMADMVGPERYFDGALWVGILAVLLASWLAIYRLVHTWQGLQKFLDIISGTPLANAFARLTPEIANISELGFFGTHRDERDDEAYAEELWSLAQLSAETRDVRDTSPSMTFGIALALTKDPEVKDHRFKRVKVAFETLRDAWEITLTRPGSGKDAPFEGRKLPDPQARVMRALEEYVAYEVVLFVERYLSNLRRICIFLFTSLLILVLVSAQYPYQPRSVVSLASVFLLIGTVAAVFWVMFSLSRNETISRISRTEPGKVTWDTTFILNAVTFGVIPLLALVSSEFPAVRSFLFSWAEPLVRAVART